MIVAKYPQISGGWLLSGEGEMFTDHAAKQNSIPFFDVDIEKYIGTPTRFSIKGYISIPSVDDAEFAAFYTGRAMGEAMPPSSIVLVRRVEVGNIIPGGDYVVVGDGFTTLRRIRCGTDPGKLRLTPVDTFNFDEMSVETDAVRELYLVRAVIINKTI